MQNANFYYEVRQTIFNVFERLVLVEFLFFMFSVAIIFIENYFLDVQISVGQQDRLKILAISSIVLFLIDIFIVAFIFAKWATFYYIIMPKRVVYRTGFFSSDEKSYSIDNIQKVELRQSLLGKFLNFGTLVIYNPVLQYDIVLSDISNPRKYLEIINNLKEEANSRIGILRR
ncbi:PH domain-containing protein [Candidatus Dojkabacteria bacterium]|nr:PH domain-containing protein [Candidatus Dojkabacteria bacterium]